MKITELISRLADHMASNGDTEVKIDCESFKTRKTIFTEDILGVRLEMNWQPHPEKPGFCHSVKPYCSLTVIKPETKKKI